MSESKKEKAQSAAAAGAKDIRSFFGGAPAKPKAAAPAPAAAAPDAAPESGAKAKKQRVSTDGAAAATAPAASPKAKKETKPKQEPPAPTTAAASSEAKSAAPSGAQSPHFASPAAAPAPAPAKSNKRRIRDDEDDDDIEELDADAVAKLNGSGAPASPAKQVVLRKEASPARASKAKDSVNAADFFGETMTAPPPPSKAATAAAVATSTAPAAPVADTLFVPYSAAVKVGSPRKSPVAAAPSPPPAAAASSSPVKAAKVSPSVSLAPVVAAAAPKKKHITIIDEDEEQMQDEAPAAEEMDTQAVSQIGVSQETAFSEFQTQSQPFDDSFGTGRTADAAASQSTPSKKLKGAGGAATAGPGDESVSGEKAKRVWKYGATPVGPSAPGSKDIPVGKPNCLTGLTFVLTGNGESLSREDASDLLKKYGAKVTQSISKKTDYVVVGSEPGEKKMEKVAELKTKMLNEDQMLQLIRDKSKGWVPPKTAPSYNGGDAAAAAAVPSVSLAAPGAALAKPVPAFALAPAGSDAELAIMRSGVQTAGSISDMLWVDAHRPMSASEIIGNPGLVKIVTEWLSTWHAKRKIREAGDPKKAAKAIKAMLISGPPGIGKTTAATVIAKSLGFEPIEFNASDVRNKKSLEAVVGDITGNRGLGEFFAVKSATTGAVSSAPVKAKPSVIVMDEVDGMGGNEDRGGMAELVSLIKSTRVPILCIANDAGSPKMKTLKNYCECITWKRVPAAQIAPRILKICKQEGLDIDQQSVEKIAESTHGDIRQILNFLQMWRKSSTVIGFDQVKSRIDAAGKDFSLGAFDVVPDLFKPIPTVTAGQGQATGAYGKKDDWIGTRQNLYFVDSDIIPLFVHENYLHAKAHIQALLERKQNQKLRATLQAQGEMGTRALNEILSMEVIAEAADSISMGDMISDAMYTEQDYSLMPSHAILSTIYPAYLMRGGLSTHLAFPALLGKQSTRNKNLRISREFATALSVEIAAPASEMAMFIMPQLRMQLLTALQADDSNGVEAVIAQLDEFGLDKDEFDLLMEWGEKFIRDEDEHYQKLIPAEKKRELTNAWKHGSHLRKVSRGAKKDSGDVSKSRGASAFATTLDDDGPSESDDDGDDDEQEEKKGGEATAAGGNVKIDGVTVVKKKAPAKAKGGAAGAAGGAAKPKKPRAPAKPKGAAAAGAAAKKGKKRPASDDDGDDDDEFDL